MANNLNYVKGDIVRCRSTGKEYKIVKDEYIISDDALNLIHYFKVKLLNSDIIITMRAKRVYDEMDIVKMKAKNRNKLKDKKLRRNIKAKIKMKRELYK